MATFSQWQRNQKLTRVAWVCGPEVALIRTVCDHYLTALSDGSFGSGRATVQTMWGDQKDIWDELLTAPSGPRVMLVHSAQALKSLALVPHLLEPEFDWGFVVFVSAEDDFRRVDRVLDPGLAALRDSRHGQLIRCCAPGDAEERATVVTHWWPGAGRNVAAALLDQCSGSLTSARHAADKATRAGLAPEVRNIPAVCCAVPGEGFADLLCRGDRRGAMAATRDVPPDSIGEVLGLLAFRLSLLPLVREAVSRREDPADTVRRLKADAWVLRQLRSYQGAYAPDRIARCRELLAIAESAWRNGVRDGVLEAVASLW